MKKFLVFASAALFALAACNKEQEEIVNPVNANDEVVLTFTSGRPQLTSETKTAWNSTTNSINWSSGDKISVGYTLGGNWMAKSSVADVDANPKVSPKFYVSNQVVIDAEDAGIGTFKVPTDFSFSSAGNAVFYGVYPNSALGSNVDYAPSLTITIPTSQAPGDNTFDPAADIMVGKSGIITLTDALPTDPIELNWTRIVAHADLTFSGLKDEGDETVSKITLTFNEDAKVAGSFYVDVTNGEVTTINSSKNEIVLSGSNLSLSSHNIKAWVSLMPVTFTSLNVQIETNKATYTRSITASKTFKQNARNVLTIKMAEATRTPKTGQLVADGYYVISYDNSMMTVGTESNTYRGSGTINVSDPDNDAIWKITYVSDSDAYTIRSLGANKDLYGATGTNSTNLTLGSGGTNLFTIEKSNSTATTYKIAPKENTSRSIGYNSGTNPARFALYLNSGSQPITLGLTSVTVTETPVITIADEEKTKEVEANATSITFTYVPNAFATAAPTVAIANNDDGVIKGTPTADNGTIAVELNPNTESTAKTATLTVSGTGIASPVTLTINQKAKLGDVFSYVFTSKSWAATRGSIDENWTSGKDGSQMSNGGIQVTESLTGANGTSPNSFTNVSKVVLTYCTNASSGAGSISVKVGNGTAKSNNVTNTGGTTHRTLEYTFSPAESGQVTITVNCSKNSIYLVGADITAASMEAPVAGISVITEEASNTSSADGKTATLNGTITLNNGAVISDVTEAGFYYKADNGSYTKVTVESPSTSLSYNLAGLTPSTVTYTYYAYAVYGGDVKNGEEKTFTTTSASGSESVVFSEQGYSDQQITSYEGTNFSITFDKGTNSNAPKYYSSGTAIRAYGGNYFTVSSSTKTITKIEITFGSSDGSNAITTDTDTYSNGTWTGSASSIKFTVGGTSGNRRIAGIKVTFGN